jgi:type I restriction-modification system DNA methylase subunit
MAEQSSQLVQKLWNYCNILRDDGLSYGDYVEQLTFLLFLRMADEQSRLPFNKPSAIPKSVDRQGTTSSFNRTENWVLSSLKAVKGDADEGNTLTRRQSYELARANQCRSECVPWESVYKRHADYDFRCIG